MIVDAAHEYGHEAGTATTPDDVATGARQDGDTSGHAGFVVLKRELTQEILEASKVPESVLNSAWERLRISIRLTFEVLMFSLIGSLAIALFESSKLLAKWTSSKYDLSPVTLNPLFRVDYHNSESVIFGNKSDQTGLQVLAHEALFLPHWGISLALFPLLTRVYLGPQLPIHAVLVPIVVGLIISFVMVATGFNLLREGCLLIVSALFLKKLVRINKQYSRIAKLFTRLLTIIFVNMVLIVIMREGLLNGSSGGAEIVVFRFCILYPLLREFSRYLATRTAWHFMFDANLVQDERIEPANRGSSFTIVCCVDLFWAMFLRLHISSTSNSTTNSCIVLFQGVLEIILRTTMEKRDKFIKSTLQCIKNRMSSVFQCFGTTKGLSESQRQKRKPTVVIADSTKIFPMSRTSKSILVESQIREDCVLDIDGTETDNDEEKRMDRQVAAKYFYSLLILVNMLCEYVAILGVVVILAINQNRILVFPAPYFAQSEQDPFSNGVSNMTPLVWSVILQIITEIAVDTFCLKFEMITSRGSFVQAVWGALPSGFTALFIYVCLLQSAAVPPFFQKNDNMANCLGMDMCYCADGNGLEVGGVRELYCIKLHGPNGVPAVEMP